MKLVVKNYITGLIKHKHSAYFGAAIILTAALTVVAFIYSEAASEKNRIFSHLAKPAFSPSFSVENMTNQQVSFTPLFFYTMPEREKGYTFAQSVAERYSLLPTDENTGIWKEWSGKGAHLRFEAISGTIRYYHTEFIYADKNRFSSSEEWKTVARKHLAEYYHYASNQPETITLYSIIGKDGNEPIWNNVTDPNSADIIIYSVPIVLNEAPVLSDNAISQTVELIMSADGAVQNVNFPWATIHAQKGRSIPVKNKAAAMTLLENRTDPHAVYITDPQIGVTKQFSSIALSSFFLQKVITAYALSQKDGLTFLTPVYVYNGEVSYENEPGAKTYPCSIYIAL